MYKRYIAVLAAFCLIFAFGCVKKEGHNNPLDPDSPDYVDPATLGKVVCYVYDDKAPTQFNPVAGAKVVLYAYEAGGSLTLVADAVSDASGRVEFTNLSPSPPNYWVKSLNNCPAIPYMDSDQPDCALWHDNGYYSTGFPVKAGETFGDSASAAQRLYFRLYPTTCSPV